MGAISENRVKFTRQSLIRIENQINDNVTSKEMYWYDSASRLAIRVRKNQAYQDCTFCLYARIRVNGEWKSKLYKRNIIKVSDARNFEMTLSDLRRKADTMFLEIQEGKDPCALAQQELEQFAKEESLAEAKKTLWEMTFGSPFDQDGAVLPNSFVAERRPGERYLYDIKRQSKRILYDLIHEPLYSLSAEQVKLTYLKESPSGQAQVHCAMRFLRSVWNWAQVKYDDSELFIRNPVSRAMKQLGVNINRTNRRGMRLEEDELKPYITSVLNLRNHDHTSGFRNGRDALLFMLFSGVRITGTVTIRMANIDFDRRSFKIVKKGGELTELPLNSVTEAIVHSRLTHLPKDTEYLFPGISGRGYYRDTKMMRTVVKEETGIAVTNHDLRRTFKSIGVEINTHYVLIDELLSHAREGINAHYVHPSLNKLREASQRIADYIIEKSEIDLISRLTETW